MSVQTRLVSMSFLSTLSLRRATPSGGQTFEINLISIHALLTESDVYLARVPAAADYFYPRSPYGERRTTDHHGTNSGTFLSTLSLRRATCVGPRPCGPARIISIHALLTESALVTTHADFRAQKFLSTLSLRRATTRSSVVPWVLSPFLSTLSLRRATL